ncbi:MAG: hypothetical protein JJT99_07455 [Rhodobacteraceae bacterium]|nr:hypothetical protein [Paracoccaceae bacterium]
MCHDWLVAQLDAMKQYAERNDLPALAQELHNARLVALVEIAGQHAEQKGAATEAPDSQGDAKE